MAANRKLKLRTVTAVAVAIHRSHRSIHQFAPLAASIAADSMDRHTEAASTRLDLHLAIAASTVEAVSIRSVAAASILTVVAVAAVESRSDSASKLAILA